MVLHGDVGVTGSGSMVWPVVDRGKSYWRQPKRIRTGRTLRYRDTFPVGVERRVVNGRARVGTQIEVCVGHDGLT